MASFFDAIEENRRNSLLLLIFVFITLIGMAWAVSYLFNLGAAGFVIFSIITVLYMLLTYYAGDGFVLAVSGAKPASHEAYPFLYDIVEGMALATSIPMPKLYVIDDPSPNAFATGRDPQHASLAVTTGLLKIMKREELEGVVAHEMSHIGNYDIRFMLYSVVLVGAIALLGSIAFHGMIWGRQDNRRGGNAILMLIAIAFLILAPISSELVRLAISRQREFLADATAAKITRYPEGLASALEKLGKNTVPTSNPNDAITPLYIVNPMPGRMMHLFSTHPAIEERVKRLRSM
jgi:heat shock protein HtpX